MSPFTAGEARSHIRHGLIPAVPVPFQESGQIDWEAQRRYVVWMARQPIRGVAVWAHTGRGLRVERDQRIQVLQSWSEGLGADQLVIAGVGGLPERAGDFPDYLDSGLAMARDALDHGAHAFLIHPPRLFHHVADNEELLRTYHREFALTGAPQFLFYLYEAAGGFAYSEAQLRDLFAMPGVAGIKLATLDSVMTFQRVASLISSEFPQQLLITGEDRFLGYSLMCGAQAALIGMGAACTGLQASMLQAFFEGRAGDFLELSRKVDRLSQVTFIPPMEGYIRRMLWALVHQGVFGRESAHDPWGPPLAEEEFGVIGDVVRALGEVPAPAGRSGPGWPDAES